MPESAPILVIDLDGTLLSVSSFRRWAIFLVRAPFPDHPRRFRVRLRAKVVSALVARRLGLLSHSALCARFQETWADATAGDGGAAEVALVDDLVRWVRPELRPTLAAVAENRVDAVLATAAVPEIAIPVAERLGFRHVVSAPVSVGAQPGYPKRDAVRALLGREGWLDRAMILLTDHIDDIPLARDATEVIWFGEEAGLRRLREAAPGVVVCPGR